MSMSKWWSFLFSNGAEHSYCILQTFGGGVISEPATQRALDKGTKRTARFVVISFLSDLKQFFCQVSAVGFEVVPLLSDLMQFFWKFIQSRFAFVVDSIIDKPMIDVWIGLVLFAFFTVAVARSHFEQWF